MGEIGPQGPPGSYHPLNVEGKVRKWAIPNGFLPTALSEGSDRLAGWGADHCEERRGEAVMSDERRYQFRQRLKHEYVKPPAIMPTEMPELSSDNQAAIL